MIHPNPSLPTLTVRAVPGCFVSDFHALRPRDAGTKSVRRYVNRTKTVIDGVVTFPINVQPTRLPYSVEYVKALKRGDLQPCDEATASLAGIDFNS
jgi:hypothetical protein